MDSEKLAELRNYYKDELTIIGFNDLEVVSNASSFFKKSLLDNLRDILRSEEVEPTIIDCFSSLMNKTEHINYYLKSNLSIEEIKLSKVYSSVLSLEKFMVNRHLPKALGKIGYLSTFKNLVNMDDDTTYITSVLEEASSPIIIYSSGYSNLKREIDFDGVNTPKNYDYTLSKIKSKKTLSKVIGGIEKNFYSILSINDKSDIYVLNAPVPDSLEEIKNLVIYFNNSLSLLIENKSLSLANVLKLNVGLLVKRNSVIPIIATIIKLLKIIIFLLLFFLTSFSFNFPSIISSISTLKTLLNSLSISISGIPRPFSHLEIACLVTDNLFARSACDKLFFNLKSLINFPIFSPFIL